jgi:hypothetical protein
MAKVTISLTDKNQSECNKIFFVSPRKNKKTRMSAVNLVDLPATQGLYSVRCFLHQLVPRTRLELAHRCRHQPLKLACLPISPSGQFQNAKVNKICSPSDSFHDIFSSGVLI